MAEEARLSQVFVELADTLVADFDVVEFMTTLTHRCAEVLGAAEVGVILADGAGALHVMASSTERMQILELFELQNAEGPCLDCYRLGAPVVNVRLDPPERWPAFAPEALRAGFRAAHALPMRLRKNVIGAVNVFTFDDRELSPTDVAVAQALADVATIGILQERAVREARVLAEQLQGALDSRVVIEQAKGVVAEGLNVDVDAAFAILRGHARGHSLRLADVARAVVDGTLPADKLRRQPTV